MARKKSITIARKPRAQPQRIDPEVLLARESNPENVGSAPVAMSTATPAEELGDRPAAKSKTSGPLGFFGKALYRTAYGVSYGVVFGALVVGLLLPGRRIIAQAITDASDAAKQDFRGLGKRLEKPQRNVAPQNRCESPGRAGEDGLIA